MARFSRCARRHFLVTHLRKLRLAALLSIITFVLTGCGGGSIPAAKSGVPAHPAHAGSVLTSPRTAKLVSGAKQQFTATISNSPSAAVTWSTTAGTVTTSGLFTAPKVSVATTISVTATSSADATMTSVATLTITPSAGPPTGTRPVTTPVAAPPATQHSVALTWKPSGNPKVISYSMYRSTVSGQSYALLASALNAAGYLDASVQSGTRYYYVVTAVDDRGRESAYSGQAGLIIP
jgi:hypothetical protein